MAVFVYRFFGFKFSKPSYNVCFFNFEFYMLKKNAHDKMKFKQYKKKVNLSPTPYTHSSISPPRPHYYQVPCLSLEIFYALIYIALFLELYDDFL